MAYYELPGETRVILTLLVPRSQLHVNPSLCLLPFSCQIRADLVPFLFRSDLDIFIPVSFLVDLAFCFPFGTTLFADCITLRFFSPARTH